MTDRRTRRVGVTLFDSDPLQDNADDDLRFAGYHAFYESLLHLTDLSRHPDLPFLARHRVADVAGLRLSRYDGTISRIGRGSTAIAHGTDDDFCLVINRGSAHVLSRQAGHEYVMDGRASVLLSNGDRVEKLMDGRAGWTAVNVSRQRLKAVVPHAEDLLARPLERFSLAHLLGRYIEGVLDINEADFDGTLERHVESTIIDLLALILGAEGDTAQLASGRGLRAIRLQEILTQVKARFADPSFSSQDVAAALGVSQRYVNKLLHESGLSFAERILELRLQKAGAMLADVRNDRLKISDIALSCGFSDVSHFNRRFRARFGASPTQYRGGTDPV